MSEQISELLPMSLPTYAAPRMPPIGPEIIVSWRRGWLIDVNPPKESSVCTPYLKPYLCVASSILLSCMRPRDVA